MYDGELKNEDELLKWLIEQKMTDTIEEVCIHLFYHTLFFNVVDPIFRFAAGIFMCWGRNPVDYRGQVNHAHQISRE